MYQCRRYKGFLDFPTKPWAPGWIRTITGSPAAHKRVCRSFVLCHHSCDGSVSGSEIGPVAASHTPETMAVMAHNTASCNLTAVLVCKHHVFREWNLVWITLHHRLTFKGGAGRGSSSSSILSVGIVLVDAPSDGLQGEVLRCDCPFSLCSRLVTALLKNAKTAACEPY